MAANFLLANATSSVGTSSAEETEVGVSALELPFERDSWDNYV
jgi:hypothetical protein